MPTTKRDTIKQRLLKQPGMVLKGYERQKGAYCYWFQTKTSLADIQTALKDLDPDVRLAGDGIAFERRVAGTYGKFRFTITRNEDELDSRGIHLRIYQPNAAGHLNWCGIDVG